MTAADLETLRQALRPAFLWDSARRRIVWANAAAVRFFGARNLADLVERPFDAREAGVRSLQEAHQRLSLGSAEELRLQLAFPSTGNDAPLDVTIRPHKLADGRTGLLAVAAQPAVTATESRLLGEIFQELPQPLLAVTGRGDPLLANPAALELLDETQPGALAGLFPSRAAMMEFLLRALDAGTAVTTREATTKVGKRILRITARAVEDENVLIITLDDLTDRLQAEQGMMPVMPEMSAMSATAGLESDFPSPAAQEREVPPLPATPSPWTEQHKDEHAGLEAATSQPPRLQPQELATLRRIMEALENAPAGAEPATEGACESAWREEQVEPSEEGKHEAPCETAPDTAHEAPDEVVEKTARKAGGEQAEEGLAAQPPARKETTEESTPSRPRISIRVTKPAASASSAMDEGEAPSPPAAGMAAEAPPAAPLEKEAEETKAKAEGTANAKSDGVNVQPVEVEHSHQEQTQVSTTLTPQERQAAEEKLSDHKETRIASDSPLSVQIRQGEQISEQAEGQPRPPLAEEQEGMQADEEGAAVPPRPEPPELVRDVLDHRAEPIILHRADAFYFANAAACDLFGHALEDAAWDDLARDLSKAHDGDEIELPDARGQMVRFRLKRDVFPWRAGVVVQSTLQPLGVRTEEDEGAGSVRIEDSAPASPSAEKSRQASSSMPRRTPAPIIRIHAERGTPPQEKQDASGQSGSSAPTAQAEGASRATPPAEAKSDANTAAAVEGALARDMDAELRTVLETAADGIITLNARGEILSFSSGAERLFGYRAEEVVGRHFRELLAEDVRPRLDHCITQLLQDPSNASRHECGRSNGREVLGLTRNGETIPLYLTLGLLHHALPRDSEHRASFCVVVHDISSFKQRETELRRAKEEAEELSARKSEFLARISHELRTPLNAILGFSDVLRQELYGQLGNEKYRDYARDIYESGEHLLALVNDLLDLARIEAGRYELNMKEVDLAAVVEDVVNLMRGQIGEAGITLRRVAPDNLPHVVADARSLKQILLNLLSNAVKFSHPGEQVVIALRQRPDGGLELVVKDTGPGMSKQELELALEPFRRVSRTGQGKPGTGLGLPLAKALTEANRARFEIDSEPGKGTEVRIIFPPHRVLM